MSLARRLTLLLAAALCASAQTADFFPVAVWYGGGKARAPMLEPNARAKKELWRKDVQQIRALGFNSIRAWIDWASGQPAENNYNFETLDVLLELAEEEGLKLFLQVYMDSAPHWIGAKYPDSRFVSAGGEIIQPESSPGYCRDHASVRQLDTAFYSALARRAARSPAFAGWDLWSEPHVINWANPTYIPRPEFCYCAHTKARFRSWLQRKYPSLDALNQAWYRTYSSWDDVEPSRLSTILSYSDYIDWKSFLTQKLGEDLRDRYEAVKRHAPASIVTSHAAGVGLFASPHHWEGQSDDWTMARQVDFYGTSFYPKHSAFVDRNVPWRAALLDFTRSFGFDQGRAGFYIGELQAGFGTIALNVSSPVTPQDLRTWTWSALARGAKGINFYAFYPMSSGYESGGFGLIELDGALTERAREAGRIASLVHRHQSLFLAARPPRAPVAVIYNPLAHFVGGRQRATSYGGPQGEVAGIERDSLLGIHHALFPLNVPIDYVHIDHLTAESLRPYKLVYFAYPLMMPGRAAAALRDYVAAGGALVAEARLGWNNERGLAAPRIPGLGLDEVMGVREAEVTTPAQGRATLHWTSSSFPLMQPGDSLPARWFQESLAPLSPHARILAEFAPGHPAAIESRFGQGRTLTLGSYLSAAYFSQPTPQAGRFFAALLQWAGITPPVHAPAGLEVRLLESGPGRLAFLFNHNATPVRGAVTLALPAALWSATDLVTSQTSSPLNTPAGLSLDTSLEPGAVQVLHLQPRSPAP